MIHGIVHDESTSADNTDVFLKANTANTLATQNLLNQKHVGNREIVLTLNVSK
jgi:hypothetical protein